MDTDTTLLFPSAKLASEVLDYAIDLKNRLGDDTIQSVAWLAPTLTVTNQGHDGTRAVVWLSGGTPGRHTINLQVTTTGGRVMSENAILVVKAG